MMNAVLRRPFRRKIEPSSSEASRDRHVESASKSLRRVYPRLIAQVDPRDEMLNFMIVNTMAGDVEKGCTYYFHTGEMEWLVFAAAVCETGRMPEDIRTMLDFASGYGRGSRFFVARYGADRVAVSDIDAEAVAFCQRTFGVRGFVSSARPEDVAHEGLYDAIFAASLFSHLSRSTFAAWIRRLLAMLNPGGLLIFSTHGEFAASVATPEVQALVVELEPGFRWLPGNETGGRLDTEQYGSAWVTDDWVRKATAEAGGKVLSFHRRGMGGYQDLYTVSREDG